MTLQTLGEQLRRARIARDMTLDDLAARMGVGRQTLARLEAGAPGVSLEALGLALWNMNLLEHLAQIAAAANDPEGQRLADLRAPSRARGRKSLRSAGWESLNKL